MDAPIIEPNQTQLLATPDIVGSPGVHSRRLRRIGATPSGSRTVRLLDLVAVQIDAGVTIANSSWPSRI